tara:strand:- start:499 stop:1263 length:765 start_codon:yes stop_codon:yes gene_type:complete
VAVEDADLSEQFQLASIIEKLVETFNTSNDKTIEDVTKRPIQSSVFNNKLNSGALQQVENSITQSLNGGEPGLYALILRSQEIEAKAEGTSTSWWSIFLDIAGEEESEDLETLKALELLNFKGYYVFVLTNVNAENPIPNVLPPSDTETSYTYQNLESYPIAQAVSKRLRTETEEITPGTLVKIQYENSINRDSPIVTEIIEDRPEFTAVILASMVARSALNQFSTCSTDSSLSGVTHPTGDTLGESQQPEDGS